MNLVKTNARKPEAFPDAEFEDPKRDSGRKGRKVKLGRESLNHVTENGLRR